MADNLPQKAPNPVEEIRSTMMKMAPQFKMALPAHVTPERFVRVLITAIQTNPLLLDCDRGTLYAAAMKAATDGLLCDGREAAIVPFRVKGAFHATYMPMVSGILKKVRNSGELESIHPEIVYDADDFDYYIDETGPHLKHTPSLTSSDRGEPRLAYVVARVKSGGTYIEVMNRADIEAVREVSRAKEYGPWSGDFALEMWKKTVIRRISKRLPVSTDLDEVIRADDHLTELPATAAPAPALPAPKSSRLAQLMGNAPTIEDPPTTFPEKLPGEPPRPIETAPTVNASAPVDPPKEPASPSALTPKGAEAKPQPTFEELNETRKRKAAESKEPK